MRLSDVLLLPEKTYTGKGNGVQGKIMFVGEVSQKGDWYSQPINLLGIDNTQAPLEHSSKYPDGMLNQSHVGKDSTWRLKWWRNTNQGGKQMLTGYPEVKIEGEPSMTAQPNPALPYNQPQNAPQPLQQANPTARTIVHPPPTPKDEIICRQTAGKVAGEVVAAMIRGGLLGSGPIEDIPKMKAEIQSELLTLSDIMAIWFIEGTVKAPEPQAQEQGVCPSCQLLRVDCTCPQQDFIR